MLWLRVRGRRRRVMSMLKLWVFKEEAELCLVADPRDSRAQPPLNEKLHKKYKIYRNL